MWKRRYRELAEAIKNHKESLENGLISVEQLCRAIEALHSSTQEINKTDKIMGYINVVTFAGYAGNDPEVRDLGEDRKVANFSIAATNKGFTKQDGTEIPDRTEWARVKCFGGLAKYVELAVKKGSYVVVHGELRTEEYEKDGVKRYVTSIYAKDLDVKDVVKVGEQTASQAPPIATNKELYRPPSLAEQKKAQALAEELKAQGDDLPF